jgi:hypothetical protein
MTLDDFKESLGLNPITAVTAHVNVTEALKACAQEEKTETSK